MILVVSGASSGVGILVRHLASTDLLWASIGLVPVAFPADPPLPCLTTGDIDKHRHQWPNLKDAACPSLSPLTPSENTFQSCYPNPNPSSLNSHHLHSLPACCCRRVAPIKSDHLLYQLQASISPWHHSSAPQAVSGHACLAQLPDQALELPFRQHFTDIWPPQQQQRLSPMHRSSLSSLMSPAGPL